MRVLECVKPGAKPGQVILAVDLSVAGNTEDVLATIERLGYQPEIRHVAYPLGVHVLDHRYQHPVRLEPCPVNNATGRVAKSAQTRPAIGGAVRD